LSMPRGMKVGAVSLWVLLLLSEKPMYGYEIMRELERRFSGFWKPKTGTIYPALERLESNGLVTSRIEFRDEAPDRKHYALTEKGNMELSQSMRHWTKMTEVLENHREAHEAIARQRLELGKPEVSRILEELGKAFKEERSELSRILSLDKSAAIEPTEPMRFKFLYGKEDEKLEIHLEIEWLPKASAKHVDRGQSPSAQ
jgi:PadR family transcriptional regulator PadR